LDEEGADNLHMARREQSLGTKAMALIASAAVAVSVVVAGPVGLSTAIAATTSASAGLDLAPNAQVGLFDDLEYLTGTALQARLDQYAALGLRWARFQMIWGTVQAGGPASYDWSNYDALISGLLARGIQPLVVIDTSPTWDRVAGCSTGLTCAPADPAAYASFAAAAAARYAPMGVHDWEIWNEPNNEPFWQPTPDPVAYTALLKDAYSAIKGVDPSATVISGGLAPEVTSPGPTPAEIAPLEFLEDVYADGGRGSFDAVGWHPYTYPEMPGVADPGSAWYQMYGTPTSVRSLMVANGDGSKKIWATEFGAPTDPSNPQSVSPAVQAQMFAQGLSLWASYSWAGPMIGYQYQDRGTDTSDQENFFGLVTASGSPKPALLSLESEIATLDVTGILSGVPTSPTPVPPVIGLPSSPVAAGTTNQSGGTASSQTASADAGQAVASTQATTTGYRLVASDGGVFSFGSSPFLGSLGGSGQKVAAMATGPNGYWVVTTTGAVHGFGNEVVEPLAGGALTAPVAAMTATPDGKGYWLVGTNGSVAAYGDAAYLGSVSGALVSPVVGAATTADGRGYWLAAADGGIFSFGDAPFYGSIGGHRLNRPVVGLAAAPGGQGYWEVASDGGIFSFGSASFFGSTGAMKLNQPVVGYWLVASDGGIFAFGDATFMGSTGGMKLAAPIIGMSQS
jgi:hypothetical protein